MFAITRKPTPLFNTPDLGSLFRLPMPLDENFLFSPLEVVLYPGVEVVAKGEGDIVQITTDDYPFSPSLYTHRHFLDFSGQTKKILRRRPATPKIIEALEKMPRLPYVWGGNFVEGVPDLFELFPVNRSLSSWQWSLYHLRGCDCSGLLYNVTNGTTARNTTPLREQCYEIPTLSKPLDLIFVPGHVLILLPGEKVIESRRWEGVMIHDLKVRLKELEKTAPWVKFCRFA